MQSKAIDKYTAQIGELLQHHMSSDPKLLETSDWYYGHLKAVLHRNKWVIERKPRRYLEIACYRHILGYRLAKDYKFESTQFDICDRDLEIGRETAIAAGYADTVERVVGDFHDLPFADNYFDVVFISASIHHTRTPDRIIGEAMRVLTDGGLFYCQREPCERLFCFYQFTANRAASWTDFERKIHERDMMRIISSPYPGARNAELFGRVENDRIPLQMYYDTFAKFGTVVEQVVYSDGLLTRPDKDILAQSHLPEAELESYIRSYLEREIDEIRPTYTEQERLLGYSLPDGAAVATMAKRVASALKARPSDPKSIEYQRAMARIFGGSLRFVVRRDRAAEKRPDGLVQRLLNGSPLARLLPGTRKPGKFRRSTTRSGNVLLDDAVYKHSGLEFWTRLLPDIQESTADELHDKAFPRADWIYADSGDKKKMMQATRSNVEIVPKIDSRALIVARYRVHVDKALPWCKLKILYGDREIDTVTVALSEDRVFRLVADNPGQPIRFELTALDGSPVDGKGRLRIPILQAIPIDRSVTG